MSNYACKKRVHFLTSLTLPVRYMMSLINYCVGACVKNINYSSVSSTKTLTVLLPTSVVPAEVILL